MRFRKARNSATPQDGGQDTDSAFSDDASSMLSSSEGSSTSSTSQRRVQQSPAVPPNATPAAPKKVLVDIYCADGSTKESIWVDPMLTVGQALKLMAEKSCVDCHVKWGLVERIPELFIDRCLEDDEKLLRVISSWKPQTPNRLIFAQRPEKYDLFRRPERYFLDPYDKASTEAVMQVPWDAGSRQALVQRCIDSVNQASTTLLEGPLWLKTEGKKWKKFHFILRDFNLFQTTKSKKGSVHDVHFVASLATVKVYNGIGWKKRYKAPTDFGFALKPPEVQEKKAHLRYLCAENEFVKWGWYSMLRLTLGPPQILVDNYNAQLGVSLPPVIASNNLSRSTSITSNGDGSMSSGCVSEVEEENAFDMDYPDGGTIRRKPANPMPPTSMADSLPLPPPPLPTEVNGTGETTPTDNGQNLPLPPPPSSLLAEEVSPSDGPIRESIYPCGIMRTRYPPPPPPEMLRGSQDDLTATGVSQLSLLQQLPSQPPPNLHALLSRDQESDQASPKRERKITFSEFVHSLEENQWEPLKGRSEDETQEVTNCKEQDVSNWVLRHCNVDLKVDNPTTRPKIYNGRSVPNCFSPQEVQLMQHPGVVPGVGPGPGPGAPVNNGRKFPPPPPRRGHEAI